MTEWPITPQATKIPHPTPLSTYLFILETRAVENVGTKRTLNVHLLSKCPILKI